MRLAVTFATARMLLKWIGVFLIHVLLQRQGCLDPLVIRHRRIRIPNLGQISRPGARIKESEHGVITLMLLQLRHPAVRVQKVAEDDRLCGAGPAGKRS